MTIHMRLATFLCLVIGGCATQTTEVIRSRDRPQITHLTYRAGDGTYQTIGATLPAGSRRLIPSTVVKEHGPDVQMYIASEPDEDWYLVELRREKGGPGSFIGEWNVSTSAIVEFRVFRHYLDRLLLEKIRAGAEDAPARPNRIEAE